eukprot:6391407-Amphidinium_carterae.2
MSENDLEWPWVDKKVDEKVASLRLRCQLAQKPTVGMGMQHLVQWMTEGSEGFRTMLNGMKRAQSTDVGSAHGSSRDLLPISVSALYSLTGSDWLSDGAVFNCVVAMLIALNALYLNPWRKDGCYNMEHPARLSSPQWAVVDRLAMVAKSWLSMPELVPYGGGSEFEKALQNVRLDYSGEL